MAITKTNFINYARCPRYVALDNFKFEKLDNDITLEEYLDEEKYSNLASILDSIDAFEELTEEKKNEHLEVMLPYYNKIELLAGNIAPKYFSGTFKYSKDTKLQESFDCKINGIRYICYVDIYNETNDAFNIIEVKATTSKKYLELGKIIDKKRIPIFIPNEKGIYTLLEDMNINIEDYMPIDDYYKSRAKLFDKLSGIGHYVYDLAVQRFIIENDLKQHNGTDKISKVKYYLAVLNKDYVFGGKYEGINPVYEPDLDGNEIITYFDMTSVTRDYLDMVEIDRKKVEQYVKNLDAIPCPLGAYCERKKTTKCKFVPYCYKDFPSKNSVFNYLEGHFGFKTVDGKEFSVYELANMGMRSMLDVPETYLNREKNQIQRHVVKTNETYIQSDKIKAGLDAITYPIYHFDYETFPCPLPRYYGEKCYTQSVFQFSLHIERKPGICDKEKDHYEFLAKSHDDNRKILIEKMIEYIDTESGGTILVYNESFEKSRMKELADIFPEYRTKLLKMRDMVFDLMYVIKGNKKLYEQLGFSDNLTMFNYYHKDMTGSFSIKKILPLFSNLTYAGMEIGNGVEAMVCYANFAKMDRKEYEYKYNKLVEYCKQDTWAMVEILRGMRKM